MAKKICCVMMLSLLVACAGQSNSGKSTVASSNADPSAQEETIASGSEIAMTEAPLDESIMDDSLEDE